MTAKFMPSPTMIVRFIDKEGKVIREVPMNRKQRRKLGVSNANPKAKK